MQQIFKIQVFSILRGQKGEYVHLPVKKIIPHHAGGLCFHLGSQMVLPSGHWLGY